MGILSFTTVIQLYNGTTKSANLLRSYDGTTEVNIGFRWGFNAVAPRLGFPAIVMFFKVIRAIH